MKLIGTAALLAALACAGTSHAQVPALNHVIVVVMENHSYDEVRLQPYTASLIATSSTCTQSYAVTHPSLPNYLALWSGNTFGIDNDNCPADGSPFTVANLGQACEAAGQTWRSYCEDLPAAGSDICSSDGYRRKHAPWTDFSNLDHTNERPLTDLFPDISAGGLPALAFVIPNQCHSTHDCSVATGDTWLAGILPTLIAAAGPRGVVILTWDEDDDYSGNHILTVFAGAAVKTKFSHTGNVDHYAVVRTICEALGLPAVGHAASAAPITDIWAVPAPVLPLGLELSLDQNYPNPFNPATQIPFVIDQLRSVTLVVYDVLGRPVRVLVNRSLPAGRYSAQWDGRDANAVAVASGVYFARLELAGRVLTRRMVLVK
jgi:acid phosphatase